MQFSEALKRTGGQSVGGQLIVHHNGTNVLVGKHHDGYIIVEETDEARSIMATAGYRANAEMSDPEPAAVPPKTRRKKGAPAAAAEAEDPPPGDDANEDDEAVHHEVLVADEAVTADDLGGGY